jgi:Ca2+-binding EF-hand superfamily protein
MAEWVDVQIRAFTKWANAHLKVRGGEIESVIGGFSDGVQLAKLIESLSGDNIKVNAKPRMRIHQVENVNASLKYIVSAGVKLEGIGAEDIVDSNPTLTLGLVWTLILRFVIAGLSEEGMSAKQGLLLWCQKKTEPYSNVDIQNFTFSWQDGLGFCALIHRHRPDLIDMDGRDSSDPHKNLNDAFDIAERELGITKLLEAEDLADVAKPDEKAVMAYVAQYYACFANQNQAEIAAQRLANFLAFQAQVQELIHDYEERTRALQKKSRDLASGFASASVSDSYNETIGDIKKFRNYRKTERREIIGERDELATLFQSIQLKIRSQGFAPYVPPSGLTVQDTANTIDQLSAAEATRRNTLNNQLRDIQERAQRDFAAVADSLAAEIESINEFLGRTPQDLESELVAIKKQKAHAEGLYSQLPAIQTAEDHQEASGVIVNSYTDHTADDLAFALDQVNKVLTKNRELVEAQIAAANVDTSLPPERVAELSEAFSHFDKDGSGRLTRLEMSSCLGSLGLVEISFDGEDPTFKSIWSSMAPNNEESVGLEAFLDYMSATQGDAMNAEQLRESFRTVAGGSDTISAEDLSRNGVSRELVSFIQNNVEENGGRYDYNAYLNQTFSL